MLFAGLIERLSIHEKGSNYKPTLSNQFDSAELFQKYSRLPGIILNSLTVAMNNSEKSLPLFFPALTILTLLKYSDEGNKKLPNIRSILDFCLGHKSEKIRILGAKALVATINPDDFLSALRRLLSTPLQDQNRLNGNTNAAYQLLIQSLPFVMSDIGTYSSVAVWELAF